MQNLNLGLIGCGSIAQYCHLPAINKNPNLELTALCDRDEGALAALRNRYQVNKLYTDVDELLSDQEVEAIIISVPDKFHIDIAISCIEAGKHVFIEKPISDNLDSANRLKKIDLKGLVIQVGHMKRCDPGLKYAKDFIDEKIENIQSIKFWYCDSKLRREIQESLLEPLIYTPKQSYKIDQSFVDNYSFLTHGIHLVDTLQYMCGKALNLVGVNKKVDDQNSWQAVLEMRNGSIANLELCVKTGGAWDEGFIVRGDNGFVRGSIPLHFYKTPAQVESFDLSERILRIPHFSKGNLFELQLIEFMNSIKKQSAPICGIDDAIYDLELLNAWKTSINEKKWVEIS